MEATNKTISNGSMVAPAYLQSSSKKEIKDVWCYNLDNEMNEIMRIADRYPYIGMVNILFSDLNS